MVTLRDIMVTDLTAVAPDMSLQEVVELFAAESITGAPVVAGGRAVGVISARDVIDFGATTPGQPSQRGDQAEWGEWETDPVDGTDSAGVFFTELYGNPGADVLARFEATDGPEWNLLAEHTVAEVMASRVASLPPDASVRDAARFMIDRGIHRVLVLEKDELVGLATATDIVRAVAEHGLGG